MEKKEKKWIGHVDNNSPKLKSKEKKMKKRKKTQKQIAKHR
jgi:hypothetical protein